MFPDLQMKKASTAPDTPKVRTRPRDTPRATKRLQKASKGPLKEGGRQDARARNEKCDFLVLKSMAFSFILPRKGQESPQEAPKRPQEPPKGLIEALKEGESRSRHKGFPDLQINKGLYGP